MLFNLLLYLAIAFVVGYVGIGICFGIFCFVGIRVTANKFRNWNDPRTVLNGVIAATYMGATWVEHVFRTKKV